MALTKAQIIESVHSYMSGSEYTRNQSAELIETLLEIIKRTLENGDDVLISGFGKFTVKEKKKRRGRNPATGNEMMLAPRRVVTFKCSGKLKEKINSGK